MACDCITLRITVEFPIVADFIQELTTPTGTFPNGQPYWQFFNSETGYYYELSQDNGVGVWKVRAETTPFTVNTGDVILESGVDTECPSDIKFGNGVAPPPPSLGWFFSTDGFNDVSGTWGGGGSTYCCDNNCDSGFYLLTQIKELTGEFGTAEVPTPTGTLGTSNYYQFEVLDTASNDAPSGIYLQLSKGTTGTGDWQFFRIYGSPGTIDPTTVTDLIATYTGTLPNDECPNNFLIGHWVDEGGSLDFGVGTLTRPTCIIPPTTTTTTKSIVTITPRNECDVLTIFPMNAICQILNPSTPESFDGSALLYITGGTPPYTVQWDSGNVGQFISGLNIGEYSATITDFYNDFTIRTTCVLTAHTPTTTTTTTTTPIPVYDPLCMEYVERRQLVEGCKECGSTLVRVQIQFYPHIEINGEPSWTGNTDYLLYWDPIGMNWEVTGSTITGDLLSDNPTTPPLLGWEFEGNPNWDQKQPIVVTEGLCSSSEISPLISVHADDGTCEEGGRIVINTAEGTPPYTYSINGGINYYTQPIFTSLQPGTYYVVAKDSLGNTSTIETVVINQPVIPIYTLTLTRNNTNKTFTITPSTNLPTNKTIVFTLDQVSTFTYWPQDAAPIPTYSNVITFDTPSFNPMIIDTTNNTTDTISCGGNSIITNVQTKTYYKTLQINGGQTITGTFTDNVVNKPTGDCEGAEGTFTLRLRPNPNCGECCDTRVVNRATGSNIQVNFATIGVLFTTTTTTAAP